MQTALLIVVSSKDVDSKFNSRRRDIVRQWTNKGEN